MTQCSDEEIGQLLNAMQAGAPGALGLAEQLIDAYPEEPRLHFLRGSMLAGAGRPIEAHAALARAVALAPEFALARFQLGFFELTSGEAQRAVATWAPLDDQLPAGHYLAHFVAGLRLLIEDRFAETIAALRAGIAANGENPPLNNDMQMLIDQCSELIGEAAGSSGDGEASATSFLLGQLDPRGNTH